MTTLDKSIIANISVQGKNFEVYVDPELANMYKEGRKQDLKNILVVEEIYSNAKKAERAKSADLAKAFGTSDILKILEIILKKGNLQLTTVQKKKKAEEKYKQIVAILLREAIDPRTNAPHTQSRIEEALKKTKINIDPNKDAREQLSVILKELKVIIPLKFEKLKIAVKIPAHCAQHSYGTLKSWGILKEEWTKDGSLIILTEIPVGTQAEFYDKINKITGGDNEVKVIERLPSSI